MSLLETLKWRYATKKMNGEKIPQEKLDYIIEAARMAPSSSGLQQYRVLVITDKELLAKILPIAWEQQQIVQCSHLLVFAAWDGYTEERIDDMFKYTVAERGLPTDAMDAYKQRLWGIYATKGAEWHAIHAAKQSYIGLGLAVAAAAEQQIDATPMEGFSNEELDELLDLKKLGLKSTLLLPLGYRDESGDWLVNLKKVRLPKENFVIELD